MNPVCGGSAGVSASPWDGLTSTHTWGYWNWWWSYLRCKPACGDVCWARVSWSGPLTLREGGFVHESMFLYDKDRCCKRGDLIKPVLVVGVFVVGKEGRAAEVLWCWLLRRYHCPIRQLRSTNQHVLGQWSGAFSACSIWDRNAWTRTVGKSNFPLSVSQTVLIVL